ncbi:membrane hypothetical protein [Gammaproteobacteria bacterium]
MILYWLVGMVGIGSVALLGAAFAQDSGPNLWMGLGFFAAILIVSGTVWSLWCYRAWIYANQTDHNQWWLAYWSFILFNALIVPFGSLAAFLLIRKRSR